MKVWKIAVLSSIGSGLEYYDFVIYMMLAPFLSEIFFPGNNKALDLVLTLGIFATAYVVRPLGGMIFGHYADRFGRKKTFLSSILLMSLATFCIGLLPSYKSLGMLSPVLLVCLRLLQGISQGAEIPGGITFVCEHGHAQKRGMLMGILMSGIGLGAMLSSWVNLMLTQHFSHEQILQQAWRIPFLLGGLLALIGFILRRKVAETHLFMAQPPATHFPLSELLLKHKLALLKSIGIILFPACLIISGLFFPAYLSKYFAYRPSEIYLAMTLSLMWSSFMLLLFGYLSDYLGRKFLMMSASLIASLFLYALFKLLYLKNLHALILFMLLYQTLIAGLVASYPSMLAEFFVTKIRYSAIAVTYNFSYSLAAFFPMLMSILIDHTNRPMQVFMPLSALSLVCFLVLLLNKDSTGKSLL
ncbi:MAG: Major facilitator family transporter [Gammaproteobacteria bacterium]|jgi:MFS family permease|nr:Major facilitator family transporter [Gammaproteobacteria bacterium]